MNWYKLSQTNVMKPYKAIVIEGGIIRPIKTLEDKIIYAMNEGHAFKEFCKEYSWFEGYARDKKRYGKKIGNFDDGVKMVVDKKKMEEDKYNLEKSKEKDQQQMEMRWDLKY